MYLLFPPLPLGDLLDGGLLLPEGLLLELEAELEDGFLAFEFEAELLAANAALIRRELSRRLRMSLLVKPIGVRVGVGFVTFVL